MHIGLSPEHLALRDELRAYFADLVTPELKAEGAESAGVLTKAALRKMGADGWLGFGWPVEFGGQGRTPIEQQIFIEEAHTAGAPVPLLTINSVAPTLMRFGTQEQKSSFLPRILAGEIQFAIGYSEPGAGTDLAALRTRAERDGDEWLINGQKIYTSIAEHADYVWLACRTDPEAPRHKGISIIIVPTDTPGFSVTPIHIMGGGRTNSTYYDNVRVPAGNVVGEVNQGWSLITNQLNHERVAIAPAGWVVRRLNEVVAWAKDTELADGRRVIDQEWVQVNLARVRAKLEYLRLLNWKVAWSATQGAVSPADASSTKVFGTELYLEAYGLLMEVLGPESALRGETAAEIRSRLESTYQGTLVLTFGGGTNEVQRDLISMFGLGFPRAKR
ncbi:MAG: acyl-CoA dehydrogenase family protein [Acidimicrobiia bacterium]